MNALSKLSAATFGTALIGLLIGELALPKIASAQRLRPVLEGVFTAPTGPMACFGYLNQTGGPIEVPGGQFNKFTPPLQNGDVPVTNFNSDPERQVGAFMVPLPAGTTRLVWTLGNPNTGQRSTATASLSSKVINGCPPTP